MLRRLKVENYALIDRLELELDDRLNIITGVLGETSVPSRFRRRQPRGLSFVAHSRIELLFQE